MCAAKSRILELEEEVKAADNRAKDKVCTHCRCCIWRLLRGCLELLQYPGLVAVQQAAAAVDGSGALGATNAVALEMIRRASVGQSGFSATAMYARVEAAENGLDKERRERVKLQSQLDTILREVRFACPSCRQRRNLPCSIDSNNCKS